MNAVVSMAFRNLARHRVKTALSALAICVSAAAYITLDGWMTGMTLDSRRNIVNYETGAAKLQRKAYVEKLDDLPMYESFSGWEEYRAALADAGFDAAPRFTFSGTLYSATGTAPVVFRGVDPEADACVLLDADAVGIGRWVRPGEFALVLGCMTADKLKAGVPSRLTEAELEGEILPLLPEERREFARSLYEKQKNPKRSAFSTRELETERSGLLLLKRNLPKEALDEFWALLADAGRMNLQISAVIDVKDPSGALDAEGGPKIRHINQLIPVTLVGTVNAPDPQINNNTAYLPLDCLEGEAGMMLTGEATELVIRKAGADRAAVPASGGSAEAAARALEAAAGEAHPPELAVFGWETYAADFIAASAGDNISMRLIAAVLFVLSFLGIANTMLLAVLERTKELGMMRAQGMTDGEVAGAVMLEAGLLGALGAAAGTALGCALTAYMVKYGIDFSVMTEQMGGDIGYRLNGVFRSAWNPPVIAASGALAALTASLTALVPARRALKMPITDALRFE